MVPRLGLPQPGVLGHFVRGGHLCLAPTWVVLISLNPSFLVVGVCVCRVTFAPLVHRWFLLLKLRLYSHNESDIAI